MILALLLSLLAATEVVHEPPPQPPKAAPQLTKLPQLLEAKPADYPPDRLAAGETADVACQVDIDEQGAVTGVKVEKGAAPDFDAAAVAAIRQFRFSPAEMDGKPAAVRIHYVYHFVIEKKPAPRPPPAAVGTIRGEVVEAGTRRPIPGADVADDTGGATATDAQGRFQLASPEGDRRLTISAPGYDKRETQVKVTAGAAVEASRVWLHRTAVGELQATVPGEKPQDAPTRRTLTHDELVNVPGSLNDPIRAVQNLPGLARAPFISGALLVRGSSPADTGIYFDGHRIPILFHLFGLTSVVNEELLDRIDFYPGGYGASYGRNLTGAIDVGTRKGDAQGLHGAVALGMYESVGFLEGPAGGSTEFAVAARRSDLDLWLSPVIKAAATTTTSGVTTVYPIYWDYQARADHKFGNGDELALILFGSDDRLTAAQSGGTRSLPLSLGLHYGFHRAIGEYKHQVSPDLTLSLSPAIGWDKYTVDFDLPGQTATGQSQTGDLTTLSGELRAEARWQPRSWISVRAGTDIALDRASYGANLVVPQQVRSLGPPILVQIQFNHVQPLEYWGEYLETPLKLGRLQLVPGLRFDQAHWSGHTNTSFDPRLWARYALDDSQSLKAYTGLYHQPPNPQQLQELTQIDPTFGNPDLGLEWAAQFGVGWEKRLSDVWSVSTEVFYDRKGSLSVRVDPVRLPNGTLYDPRYQNNGIGRAWGLELLVRREITAELYGWLAYTLSKSEILNNPGDQWRAFQFDQTHILTAIVGWRPNPRWLLSSRLRFVSGNPYAPVDFATFDADSGNFVATRGEVGDAREPYFLQLDGQVQYTWTWDWWKLALYLDVQNLTNHTNEEFHVYDYRYRAQGSIQGIPILPTFGLKGTF